MDIRCFIMLIFFQWIAQATFCRQTPEIKIPGGHFNEINDYVGISTDLQQAITSDGRTVIVWDIQTACAIRIFDDFLNDSSLFKRLYREGYTCVKAMFSADGRYVFMFMKIDTPGLLFTDILLQFDRSSGRFIKQIELKRSLGELLTADGRYLICKTLGTLAPQCRIIDIESGKEIQKIDLSYRPSNIDPSRVSCAVDINNLTWSADGKKMIAGATLVNLDPARFKTERVVAVVNLEKLFQKKPPLRYANQVFWEPEKVYNTGDISGLAISPLLNYFAYYSKGHKIKKVYVWDFRSDRPVDSVILSGDGGALKFSTGGDSLYIYSKNPDGTMLWRFKKKIMEEPVLINSKAFKLADVDDPANFLVLIHKKNEVFFTNRVTGKKSVCKSRTLPSVYNFFSLDGRQILTVHSRGFYTHLLSDSMVYYWGQRLQRENRGLLSPQFLQTDPNIFSNTFSSVWKTYFTGNKKYKPNVRVWNLFDGNVTLAIPRDFISDLDTVNKTGTYFLKNEYIKQSALSENLYNGFENQKIYPAGTKKDPVILNTASLTDALWSFIIGGLAKDGLDGIIKYYKPGVKLIFNSKKDSVRLYGIDSTEWLLLGKDGYFMASRNAAKSIFYTFGNKVLSFDQFDLQFNRPDKVLDYIGIAPKQIVGFYKRAYDKRLEKMGFDNTNFEKERSFNAPFVKIFWTRSLPPFKNRSFKLSVEGEDRLFLLDRFYISVNGVPVFGTKGHDLRTAKTKKIKQEFTLELSRGNNIIDVSVLNEKGVESLKERIEVEYSDTTGKDDLYLITIGAGKYSNALKNLEYAAKDAHDVTALFKLKAPVYQNVISYTITNEEVTTQNILRLYAELKKSKVNDRVIIFYAGHGLVKDNYDYYLGTYNTDFSDPARGGLRFEDLENLLNGIPSRNKLLLVDACHSGEIDKGTFNHVFNKKTEKGKVRFRAIGDHTIKQKNIGLEDSFEMMRQLFVDLRRSTGANVISSAAGGEYSWEGEEWKNGIFTYCFLLGLKEGKADLNKDGKIMVSELLEYIQQKVPGLTDGKQTPTSRTENLVNDARIW